MTTRRTGPDPAPDPTWQPSHPLTPHHLERAQIAAARVRGRVADPVLFRPPPPPGALPALPVAPALHPRFCLMCGGRPDAEGFVRLLLARLGIVAPAAEPPRLAQLVTGAGGRRLAEEERRRRDAPGQ